MAKCAQQQLAADQKHQGGTWILPRITRFQLFVAAGSHDEYKQPGRHRVASLQMDVGAVIWSWLAMVQVSWMPSWALQQQRIETALHVMCRLHTGSVFPLVL
mmetsp:Transcript_60754/g.141590  ORF Transcript_60754/g.141590 Transcript_60754/m.141590 type:complete len:102 (-) Transcript_60754:92-397(-)